MIRLKIFKCLLTAISVIFLAAAAGYAQGLDTLKIKAEADSLRAQADSLKAAGQMEEALKLYHSALADYEKIGDMTKQSSIHVNLGIVCNTQKRFENALTQFEMALELDRKSANRDSECDVLRRIGRVYGLALYNQSAATSHLLNSLELAREIGDRKQEAGALFDLARHYDNNARWDSTLILSEQALLIFRELGDRTYEAYSLNLMGINRRQTGDYAQALVYFNESLDILNELKHLYGQFYVICEYRTRLQCSKRQFKSA